MGKNKTRKTRWRTLPITDEHSDSEESNSTTASRLPEGYQQKSYYNKFSYSSQSTPRRRYQHDGAKSTRSSSTASENKITFNEDEYTRITTPRQDVLFKKGYLNKPKSYQTQTSTGTSTTSTGNSTGNGTPDHQSTDLDYESQFVFPNGFVDHNGIYYVNSFESYPLMLYNAPSYYPEISNCKSKRYSTGSLTESISPNNEEATSQDLSGGETSNNVSDYSGHHPVYNMVYPGYFVNGVCPSNDPTNGECSTDQNRRTKKRRRRKSTKSQLDQDSSEYTEDESDEEISQSHLVPSETPDCLRNSNTTKEMETEIKTDGAETETKLPNETSAESNSEEKVEQTENLSAIHSVPIVRIDEEKYDCSAEEGTSKPHQSGQSGASKGNVEKECSESPKLQKYDLKPDAEEFVPRAYRNSELLSPNVQFIKVPPNFVPIPMMPIGEFDGQNFNPAFIPSGVPINFLPPDPKMFSNFLGFASFTPKAESDEHRCVEMEESVKMKIEEVRQPVTEEGVHPNGEDITQNVNNKAVDIATVVSRLEEAAKEQEVENAKKKTQEEMLSSPIRRPYGNKELRADYKFRTNPSFKRNTYKNPQNSPQKNYLHCNGSSSTESNASHAPRYNKICSELTKNENPTNSMTAPNKSQETGPKDQVRNSPEKVRKSWKQHPFQGGHKWQPNSFTKRNSDDFKPRQNIIDEGDFKSNKNYSEMVRNKANYQTKQKDHDERQIRKEPPKMEIKTDASPKHTSKLPNEWISVSSRKKRKNKNLEESEQSFEDQAEEQEKTEEHCQTELFESYDVNLLEDVVPPAKNEDISKIDTKEEKAVEGFINIIAQNETNSTQIENNSVNLNMRSVSDIERELITETEPEEEKMTTGAEEIVAEIEIQEQELPPAINVLVEKPAAKELLDEKQPVEQPSEEILLEEPEKPISIEDELPELNIVSSLQQEIKSKGKKKSKKGVQKPSIKRVIITDVDLSTDCKEIKTPVKKVVKKLEEVKVKPAEKPDVLPTITVQDDQPNVAYEEEKKKNKKKKKANNNKAAASNGSLSSSSTAVFATDDSYDFLLDSALTEEHVEKTNVEISQELDMIIQKGMYSSLEEKIKLLNIDESDGFFKSVFSKISPSREPSVEKTGFTKIPDFTKLLQNTNPVFKTGSSVSEENNYHTKEINKILPDLDSTRDDGIFLENPDVSEILQDRTTTTNSETKGTNREGTTTQAKTEMEVEPKNLYPITQAVKDWMCRTRETTPDLELLKSPSTIFKEFCDSANSDTETEVSDTKNSSSLSLEEPTVGIQDEVTLFSKNGGISREGSVEQPDLLDCWENELPVCENPNECYENGAISCETNCHNGHIDQGEDVLEVYDSKYGKNEDYLKIRQEVKEKSNSFNYPKHGNLPYRAICCSIM